ncbi:MAG: N-acetyldiaminopimelate deacetylase [Anaerosporomusa subterranea]|jgi:amidohydrolase|nr:N-acetyldiaminopimelate deacetylase [Anaerosporomusa subterranea]
MSDKISQLAKAGQDWVISLRRHFHMWPELGGEEFETQRKIIEELRSLGLEPHKAAGTGVVADLRGALPGKLVALRADIDALPIQDEIDQPYRSQHSGRCHACGHDAHAAMLLGTAKVLSQLRQELAGTVRFIFQPSEEKFPGGAQAMIADGALKGVASIIGTHVWQDVPAGQIGITHGRLMAEPDAFTITIQGKGGHGSMPHQTVDPIFVGSQIVVALKSVIGCNMDPLEPVVLSLGMFKAGEVYNVIPDKATLLGTVRTFDETVRGKVFKRIDEICTGICSASGATYTLEPAFGYPALVNNPEVSKLLADVGAEVLGDSGVKDFQPVMGGEDFSYYLQDTPGAFFFLGIGNVENGVVYPQHHPKFDIDETALVFGVEIMAKATLRMLAKS